MYISKESKKPLPTKEVEALLSLNTNQSPVNRTTAEKVIK